MPFLLVLYVGSVKKSRAGKAITKRHEANETSQLYIRTERQNLVGFPQTNAFLFTIRTYFYEVNLLENDEKKALWSAVRSMSPESLAYKGLTGVTNFLLRHLLEQ